MDEIYESKYHLIEQKHWWCRSRRDIFLRFLKSTPRDARILEIGCAGGLLLQALRANGFSNLTGIDLSKKAIQQCKRNGIANAFVMDGAKTTFSTGSFDIVIASDILEHIPDDAAALREWQRILKPGGKLIVFVPAFPFLWSEHDVINHHQRRYQRQAFSRILRSAGFSIERLSAWNLSLFLPASLWRVSQRVLPRKRTRDQAYLLPAVANSLLTALLRVENMLLTKINLPVGVSLFAVARKR